MTSVTFPLLKLPNVAPTVGREAVRQIIEDAAVPGIFSEECSFTYNMEDGLDMYEKIRKEGHQSPVG